MSSWLLLIVVANASAGIAQPARHRVDGPFVESGLECDDGSIAGLVELTDGGTLVACENPGALQLVDWSGKPSRQIGARGRGPGEYMLVVRLLAAGGDSALLAAGRKIVVATKTGSRDGMILYPNPTRGGVIRGADESGRMLFVKGFRFRSRDGRVSSTGGLYAAESILVLALRSDGRTVDTIARIRGPYRKARDFRMFPLGRERGSIPASLGNPAVGGDEVTMFPDGWIAIAYRNPYRVDWIRPDRSVIRGSPLPYREVPLDDRLKREWLEMAFEGSVDGMAPTSFDDWPAFVPPFVRAFSTVASHPFAGMFDGRLLIARPPQSRSAEKTYDIINRRGGLDGVLTTPPGMTVVHVGRFGLYALVKDADDVQHLRRYRRPFP
jgi:hypothetical protein